LVNTLAEEDDSLVKFGGLVPDDETDEVEEAATQQAKLKKESIVSICTWRIYFDITACKAPMVKIEPNPVILNQHKSTLKAARNGDKKWKLCHLPGDNGVQRLFTDEVAPQVCKKAGTLPPWDNPSVVDIQVVVDNVFGKGTYIISEDNVWYGLVSAHFYCIHNYTSQCRPSPSPASIPGVTSSA
jgi:hypothetical protein